jgi:beta-lactamase superfamily II metal-dependent hydrolase
MFCEIEFLPVGTGSRPGDAIVVRYGDPANYQLMLVDGGIEETGELIVSHLKTWFGNNVRIADVVLTHSDADHASGLRNVLHELPVATLWMHLPWAHAAEARPLFKNKAWTVDGLTTAIKKEYDIISEIVDIATEKRIPINLPFEGFNIGPFRILNPTRYAYIHLLPQFDKTPEPDQGAIGGMWIGKQPGFVARLVDKLIAKAQTWADETWDRELLRDGGITSASNESSVVLYGDVGAGRRVLLTGDAGVEALTWAANYADAARLPLRDFGFVQIPHHGSRRNVGPTILNRLLGPIQPQGAVSRFTAFVSAPADDATHPRKMVINAFLRRGGHVLATQGQTKIWYGGFPRRPGYVDLDSMPFFPRVEEYD